MRGTTFAAEKRRSNLVRPCAGVRRHVGVLAQEWARTDVPICARSAVVPTVIRARHYVLLPRMQIGSYERDETFTAASGRDGCPRAPQRTTRDELSEPSGIPVGDRSQLLTLSARQRHRSTLHRPQQKCRRKRPREPAPHPFCGRAATRAGTLTKPGVARMKGELSRVRPFVPHRMCREARHLAQLPSCRTRSRRRRYVDLTRSVPTSEPRSSPLEPVAAAPH
jgi:hypothetical protein